jgi:hypothetical protein
MSSSLVFKRICCTKDIRRYSTTTTRQHDAELESVLQRFNFKNKEDWYSVKLLDLYEKGASTNLLERYQYSLPNLLSNLYRNYITDRKITKYDIQNMIGNCGSLRINRLV